MEGYNGYSNYETWNLMLWINNTEELYQYWEDRITEILLIDDSDPNDLIALNLSDDIYTLSEEIQTETEKNNPLIKFTSFYSDILSNSIQKVNYYEIAKLMINDYMAEEHITD